MKGLRIFIIGFLWVSSQAFSQNANKETLEELKSMAHQMFVDVNNKDYDAILEMCHPKLFELVPKEQFKSIFKSTLEGNEDFSIEISEQIPAYELSKLYKEKNIFLKLF